MVIFIVCTKANLSHNMGFLEILKKYLDWFLSLKTRIKILADKGYHKKKLDNEIALIHPNLHFKIEIIITPKTGKKHLKPAKQK